MANGQLSQQVVENVGTAVQHLPPEVQPKAVLEATGHLAQWMQDRKTFVGPDGKVVNVDSPKAAQTEAVSLINNEVERQTTAKEEAQKAQQDAQQKVLEQQQKDAETAAQEREQARQDAEKNSASSCAARYSADSSSTRRSRQDADRHARSKTDTRSSEGSRIGKGRSSVDLSNREATYSRTSRQQDSARERGHSSPERRTSESRSGPDRAWQNGWRRSEGTDGIPARRAGNEIQADGTDEGKWLHLDGCEEGAGPDIQRRLFSSCRDLQQGRQGGGKRGITVGGTAWAGGQLEGWQAAQEPENEGRSVLSESPEQTQLGNPAPRSEAGTAGGRRKREADHFCSRCEASIVPVLRKANRTQRT